MLADGTTPFLKRIVRRHEWASVTIDTWYTDTDEKCCKVTYFKTNSLMKSADVKCALHTNARTGSFFLFSGYASTSFDAREFSEMNAVKLHSEYVCSTKSTFNIADRHNRIRSQHSRINQENNLEVMRHACLRTEVRNRCYGWKAGRSFSPTSGAVVMIDFHRKYSGPIQIVIRLQWRVILPLD